MGQHQLISKLKVDCCNMMNEIEHVDIIHHLMPALKNKFVSKVCFLA